jgi:hypothetical protein
MVLKKRYCMLVISSGYLYFEVLYLIKEKIRAKNKGYCTFTESEIVIFTINTIVFSRLFSYAPKYSLSCGVHIRVLLALSRMLGMIKTGQYQEIELKFVVR